ncbi:hypothetical protein SNEBB_003413 [Seison nebaliae]|nr:hypothetical protein SNEBB_003413 [Seison nebaliae]
MLRALNRMVKNRQNFNELLNVKFLECKDGHTVSTFKVENKHINDFGSLHGGMSATLIDIISSWTLLTSKHHMAGVTVSLNVDYLKGVAVGEEVEIHSKVSRCGRQLAFLNVEILNEKKDIAVKGSHIKFVGKDNYEQLKQYVESLKEMKDDE